LSRPAWPNLPGLVIPENTVAIRRPPMPAPRVCGGHEQDRGGLSHERCFRRRRGSGTATGRGRRAGHVGRPCSAMPRRAAWRWD